MLINEKYLENDSLLDLYCFIVRYPNMWNVKINDFLYKI